MTNIDIVITVIFYLVPIIITIILISTKKGEAALYSSGWGLIASYLAYRSVNYSSDIILFSAYIILFVFLTIWGLRLLITRFIEERSRIVSDLPSKFIIKAIKETSNEMDSKWICEFKRKVELKTKNTSIEIGLLKLKNSHGIYIKSRPYGNALNIPLLTSIFFLIITLYLIYNPSESTITIINYPIYLPVISLILGIYVAYVLLTIRKSILVQLSHTIIIAKKKLELAKKVYETLRTIALAEAVKRRIAREKIKKAAEIAKAIDKAEKILEKEKLDQK